MGEEEDKRDEYAKTAVDDKLSSTVVGQRCQSRPNLANTNMKTSTGTLLEDVFQDSVFFQSNASRALPVFRADEIELGDELGRGEFGIVYPVTGMHVPSVADKEPPSEQAPTSTVSFPHEPPVEDDDESSDDDNKDIGDDDENPNGHRRRKDETNESYRHRQRLILSRAVYRNGKSRYALKVMRLKDNIDHALDLASEAHFLQHLKHTNIVRLRGLVEQPGSPDFGLIMDVLTETLHKRLWFWKREERRKNRAHGIVYKYVSNTWWYQRFWKKLTREEETFLEERLLICLDIARALRHLHRHRIMYRDLKPENVGFNCRGHVQIFDFGLAKELKDKDLVEAPDRFRCTGETGSRRFMAPEVIQCEPYGLSCDVFSFSLLFWQILALQTPFPQWDPDTHFAHVVKKKERPHSYNCQALLSRPLYRFMDRQGWAHEPERRAKMDDSCWRIQNEVDLRRVEAKADAQGGRRTNHLTNVSLQSWADQDE